MTIPTKKLRGLLGLATAVVVGVSLISAQLKHVEVVMRTPHGSHRHVLWTFRHTVRGALAASKIPVSPRDMIAPRPSAPLRSKIVIKKAIPVLITNAQHHFQVWTADYRVGSVLHQLSIKLRPHDIVKPAVTASIRARSTITVIQRWWTHKTRLVSLPYTVQRRADATLAQGRTALVQNGQVGQARVVTSQLMQNGRPVTTRTQTTVLRQPLPQIVVYGTKAPLAQTSMNFVGAVRMISTAYWPDPAWSTGITSTGIRAQYGVAAVDPSVIPLGTHLYIPGYGRALAADTGGGIVGDRIDLCFNDNQQAVDWGVRPVTVYILASSSAQAS